MESSLAQLNHYHDNQTTVQLHSRQPTTSNKRTVIQLQKGAIRTSNEPQTITCANSRLQQQQQQNLQQQPQQQQQTQHTFSQPSTASNLGLGNINNATTYHVSTQPNINTDTQQAQPLPQLPASLQPAAQHSQNPYQFKCSLLEYHIHEAILVNKALRSELQEYKEKIAFEKKLRTVLIDRVKGFTS